MPSDSVKQQSQLQWKPYYGAVVAVTSDKATGPRRKVSHRGGAGTLIHVNPATNRGIVLTAFHVVEGSNVAAVHWGEYEASAKVIGIDVNNDLAALDTQPPKQAMIMPVGIANALSDYPAANNEIVELVGCGGIPVSSRTRHINHATLGGYENNWFIANVRSIGGDSGGPLIHRGCLYGVISQVRYNRKTRAAHTIGPHAGIIRRFLDRIAPDVIRPPNDSNPPIKETAPPDQSTNTLPDANLTEILNAIRATQAKHSALIDKLANRGELSGAAGRDGIDGRDGKDGRDGIDADANIEDIAKKVIQALQ